MARKTKGQLPSGNIRIQVYDYTDENNKKHYQSFTAPTKAEAQAMAAEWKANKAPRIKNETVLDTVKEYVAVNQNRLSVTTYKLYKGYIRYYESNPIGKIKLKELTNMDVQRFINTLAANMKPKSVKNVYLLLKPAVELKRDDFRFRVKLPEIVKNEKYIPPIEDINAVYDACNCVSMQAIMLLAIQGMMRRGEISALKWSDVDFDKKTIDVNKSYALTIDNEWELKSTKENASIRTIRITDKLIDLLNQIERTGDEIFNLSPSKISNRLDATEERAKVKKFGLHCLRHFGESTASSLNIPPVYIESIGGWERGSDVRTRTYDHVINIEKVRFEKLYLDKIDSILGNISHEVSHA